MSKQITELTIDRSRWQVKDEHRGNGASMYDSETRRMCCLGFLARKCGAKVSSIENNTMPNSVQHSYDAAPYAVTDDGSASDWSMEAASINDSPDDVKTKEAKLKKHFADVGVTLKFTGRLNG